MTKTFNYVLFKKLLTRRHASLATRSTCLFYYINTVLFKIGQRTGSDDSRKEEDVLFVQVSMYIDYLERN